MGAAVRIWWMECENERRRGRESTEGKLSESSGKIILSWPNDWLEPQTWKAGILPWSLVIYSCINVLGAGNMRLAQERRFGGSLQQIELNFQWNKPFGLAFPGLCQSWQSVHKNNQSSGFTSTLLIHLNRYVSLFKLQSQIPSSREGYKDESALFLKVKKKKKKLLTLDIIQLRLKYDHKILQMAICEYVFVKQKNIHKLQIFGVQIRTTWCHLLEMEKMGSRVQYKLTVWMVFVKGTLQI